MADTIARVADAMVTNVVQVVRGKRDEIRLALCCLFTEGHLLLDDELGRVASRALAAHHRSSELTAGRRVVGDPYPPFPAHDLGAPQRIAVASPDVAPRPSWRKRLRVWLRQQMPNRTRASRTSAQSSSKIDGR